MAGSGSTSQKEVVWSYSRHLHKGTGVAAQSQEIVGSSPGQSGRLGTNGIPTAKWDLTTHDSDKRETSKEMEEKEERKEKQRARSPSYSDIWS